jgi:hypothetical protein
VSLVNSRIRGEFKGCTGDTVFQLDNGQVWQQIVYKYKYKYKYRPRVTIAGSIVRATMTVEGLEDTPIVVRKLA